MNNKTPVEYGLKNSSGDYLIAEVESKEFQKEDLVKRLSAYIKSLRNAKGWSQRDLAAESGVSNAEISRIESGQRKNPSPAVLKNLANSLGVSEIDMFKSAGVVTSPESESAPDETEILTPEILKIAKSLHLNELSRENLKQLQTYSDYLLSTQQ